jgi:hypothetical protein
MKLQHPCCFLCCFLCWIFRLGGLKDDSGKTEMISVIFVRQNGGNKETIEGNFQAPTRKKGRFRLCTGGYGKRAMLAADARDSGRGRVVTPLRKKKRWCRLRMDVPDVFEIE